MPGPEAVLEILPRLSGWPVTLGLFVGAALAVVWADWRLTLLGLLLEYLLVSALLSRTIQPEVALIKLLAGGLAGVILYLTARQLALPDGAGTRPRPPGDPYLVGFTFRLLAVLLLALISYGLLLRFPRPEISTQLNLAAYWLPAAALLLLILASQPFKIGCALLLLQLGFEAYYANLEGSLSVNGLLGIVTLAVALTTSYLMVAASEAEGEAEELIPQGESRGGISL